MFVHQNIRYCIENYVRNKYLYLKLLPQEGILGRGVKSQGRTKVISKRVYHFIIATNRSLQYGSPCIFAYVPACVYPITG